MQDKELKKLGWKLALLPSFRKWYQKSVMDFEKEKYERIEKENQYLKEMLMLTEKRLKNLLRRHEEQVSQILYDETDEIDPLLYIKYGLRPATGKTQEKLKNIFEFADRFGCLTFGKYPSVYNEGIKKRIEANTVELPNPAGRYIQRYFYNDSDQILIRLDSTGFSAGLYNSRELYEKEKIKKENEIEEIIEDMAR
jgi:hypothetical protein